MSLNDDDRAQWIDNDEGLYNWWRQYGLSKREFIRQNRDEITNVINAVNEDESQRITWPTARKRVSTHPSGPSLTLSWTASSRSSSTPVDRVASHPVRSTLQHTEPNIT